MERFIIGIDVAADTFTAALYRDLRQGCSATAEFANKNDGFEELADWLTGHEVTAEETLICIENTGVYSEALCYWLDEQDYAVALVAPYRVWKSAEDGPKNDRIDSERVAEYALRYRDRLRLWQPHEDVVEQIKTLLSTREQLVEQRTATKNVLRALRRKVVQTPTATQALEATVAHLSQQIEAIMAEMRRLIAQHPTMAHLVSVIMTAPGAGLLLAAHLLVVTEGFEEPAEYRKLAARLGICPHEHSSGSSVWRPASSRGHGPAMMRKLLHLAARSVATHQRSYRHYYLRKQAEGKPRRLVLNNIANKLLRVLCGMIKHKQPYQENYQSINPVLLQNALTMS